MTFGPSLTAGNSGIAQRLPTIGLPEFSAILALVSLYSYVVYYLFGHGAPFLQPNYVYSVVYFLGSLVYATNERARQGIAGHTTVLALWVALIIIMAFQFLVLEISPEGLGLFYGRIHFFLTLLSMIIILNACKRLDVVIATLGWVIVAGCVVNVAEFFFAGTMFDWMSNVPGRAAGFYENANDSAMFICMGIPIVGLGLSARLRWVFYAVTLIGVYVTFSRGGLISWGLFAATTEVVLGSRRRGWGTRALVMMMAALCTIGALSYFSSDIEKSLSEALWPYLDANTSARMEFLSNDSTDERMSVLQHGLEAFASAPLFGQGVGYTHAWEYKVSVHNMIVLMLAELGLIGGFWYALFLLSLWKYGRPYGVTVLLIILVTGFFSHNHLERPAVAMIVALYVVAARTPSLAPPNRALRELRRAAQ